MDQIAEWTKVYLGHKDVTPIVDKQINEFAKRFGK
jgi:hypothetical protein